MNSENDKTEYGIFRGYIENLDEPLERLKYRKTYESVFSLSNTINIENLISNSIIFDTEIGVAIDGRMLWLDSYFDLFPESKLFNDYVYYDETTCGQCGKNINLLNSQHELCVTCLETVQYSNSSKSYEMEEFEL